MDLLKPVGYDRGGPLFSKNNIIQLVINDIKSENGFFKKRGKEMTIEIEEVNDKLNSSIDNISKNIDRLNIKEKEFIDNAKRVSSGVRKNSESLVTGIKRIKDSASFEELEKYTSILERFTEALERLDMIQSKGKLEKITQALK
jgi:transcriptional regulator of heat shock response